MTITKECTNCTHNWPYDDKIDPCPCECHKSNYDRMREYADEMGRKVLAYPLNSAGPWEERIAMNIVHQIGDALYEALPPDVAHEHFVKARQATNDKAIDFATKLIREQFIPLADLKKIIEGMRKKKHDDIENCPHSTNNGMEDGTYLDISAQEALVFNAALDAITASLEKPNKYGDN